MSPLSPMFTSQDQKFARALIWGIALCLAVLAALMGGYLYQIVTRPAPFSYTAEVFLPKKAGLCPGEVVEWTSDYTIHRAPTVLRVVRELWDEGRQKIVLVDQTPRFSVWTKRDNGKTFTSDLTYTLPKNLNAGTYFIKVGGSASNSESAAYHVPFIIPESCTNLSAPIDTNP